MTARFGKSLFSFAGAFLLVFSVFANASGESDGDFTEALPGSNNVDQSDPCSRGLQVRATSKMTGTEFIKSIGGDKPTSTIQSDDVIMNQVACGNIPSSVTRQTGVPFGEGLMVCVSNDFLAIGTDQDNVRLPMGQRTATKIMAKLGCILPTAKMVETIYNSNIEGKRIINFTGRWEKGDEVMSDFEDILGMEKTTDELMRGFTGLGVGHRKNICFAPGTKAAGQSASKVAIYGAWHDGQRTQGKKHIANAHSHGHSYRDYSHGARCINKTAYKKEGGKWKAVPIADLMTDPKTSSRFLNGTENSKLGEVKTGLAAFDQTGGFPSCNRRGGSLRNNNGGGSGSGDAADGVM